MGAPAPAREHRRLVPGRSQALAVIVALACVALTGCAANFGAQTYQQYQPGVGTDDRSQTVFVLNCLVIAKSNGEGTVVGTLINQAKQDDQLVSVNAVGYKSAAISANKLTSPIPLASQVGVKLQTGGAVRLTGPGVVLGDYVTVTFTFAQAAPIMEQIPVTPAGNMSTGMYSGIPVGPPPTTANGVPPSAASSTAP